MGRNMISERTTSTVIYGCEFLLHPTGAMYWTEKKMLVISDVHLGKISHFRKFGSAVPQDAVAGNFQRLSLVMDLFCPENLIFLGDLFHSGINKEWLLFENWLKSVRSRIILVEGNHDIISPHKYKTLGVEVVPEITCNDFLFTHHPEKRKGVYNFSGHIHPGVKLTGLARQTLRLSCFFKTSDQMILPAFGEFTGKHILSPKKGDEVYVLTGEKVILLS